MGFSEPLPNLKPMPSAEGKEVTSESPWVPRRRLVPSLLVTLIHREEQAAGERVGKIHSEGECLDEGALLGYAQSGIAP